MESYKLMQHLAGKFACCIYLENWDTLSILNIASPQATAHLTTLPVARPTKPAISIALVFQHQRFFMLSINAHAGSFCLHFWLLMLFLLATPYSLSSLSYYFNDTLSLRKICNLQMRSCLLLALIVVVPEEILYMGHTYRTESLRSDWLPFIFSIPNIKVKFQTLINNNVHVKGFNRNSKTFMNEGVAISICTEVVIWTKSYWSWLHTCRKQGRELKIFMLACHMSDIWFRFFKQHQFYRELCSSEVWLCQNQTKMEAIAFTKQLFQYRNAEPQLVIRLVET